MYKPKHINNVKKQYPVGSTINNAWRYEDESLTVTGYILRENLNDNTSTVEIRTKTNTGHEVILELSQLPRE